MWLQRTGFSLIRLRRRNEKGKYVNNILQAEPSRLSQHDRVHRIVQTSCGRSIRSIITGVKVFETRSMPSRKCGWAIYTEAGVEPIVAKSLEFDPNVVSYKAQPCRLEGICNGKSFTMVNDFAVLRFDGVRKVLEVKASRRQLQDAFYRDKLELAEEAYAAMGWRFRVVFKEDFSDPVVRDNIEIAFVSRFSTVTERHKDVTISVLRNGNGLISLGHLSRALERNHLNGRAVAYAMMALRIIAIDLTRPFSDDSVVSLTPTLRPFLPSLRF